MPILQEVWEFSQHIDSCTKLQDCFKRDEHKIMQMLCPLMSILCNYTEKTGGPKPSAAVNFFWESA